MATLRHIVGLSGGKDSTCMAIRLKELSPNTNYEFVCTPTGNELPEMVEHWNRLEQVLQAPLLKINSGQSLYSLILKQRALPNWRMRWCTRMLKILPFQEYVLDAASDPDCAQVFTYVGIRYDEIDDRTGVPNWGNKISTVYPLVEWKYDIVSVKNYLECHNIIIPTRTDCALCFFQTLSEWHTLWRDNPIEYNRGIVLENWTQHTFRSAQRDTHPASLEALAKEFESGFVPKPRNMSNRSMMCSTCAR